MRTKVVIFEDHKQVMEALATLVSSVSDFVITGKYYNAENILEKIKESTPDVILMDIQMPKVTGIEAVRTIKQQFPDVRIVMQTVFDDDDNLFAAICAGASGYILKNSPPEKIIEAISEAHHGGAPMTAAIAARVLALFKTHLDQPAKETSDLSPREKEILQHLVKGLSYKMIAAACDITYDTVRFHIKNIYAKLHVSSMTEAVAKAINHRLV